MALNTQRPPQAPLRWRGKGERGLCCFWTIIQKVKRCHGRQSKAAVSRMVLRTLPEVSKGMEGSEKRGVGCIMGCKGHARHPRCIRCATDLGPCPSPSPLTVHPTDKGRPSLAPALLLEGGAQRQAEQGARWPRARGQRRPRPLIRPGQLSGEHIAQS